MSVPSDSGAGSVLRRYWDTPFAVEVLLLALAAPALYFPGRFPAWAAYASFGLLAAGWLWRRFTLGIWFRRTPADWPLFFLFLVMLPVSLWAAPGPLREEYSIPKAYILLWNFALFWVVVSHGSRRRELFHLLLSGFIALGVLVSTAALFGTQWASKFPLLGPILRRLPTPLMGRFAGAESGFNPNQVAGTLLYLLPLLMALSIYMLLFQRPRHWLPTLMILAATGLIGLVTVVSQSRAGLLGLSAGTLFMLLFPWRWGRWTLGIGLVGVLAAVPFLPAEELLSQVESAQSVQSAVGAISLAGRVEIWNRALYGIADFSFTGMGLGTFREIVHLLYPLFLIPPNVDIAHAHNFFLQMALDFGLPGLLALLAVYLTGVTLLLQVWNESSNWPRAWAVGLLGTLVAQIVYSQADAVAMGAKTNLLLWYLLGFVFVTGASRHKNAGVSGWQNG